MPFSVSFDAKACAEDLMAAYRQAVEELIKQAEREANARCPADTGNLRSTIESAVTVVGQTLIEGIVSAGGLRAYYAPYTERGIGRFADDSIPPYPQFNPRRVTYPGDIVPWGKGNQWVDIAGRTHPGADWLVFTIDGKKIFAKRVRGYQGKRWLEDTFKWLIPSCREAFADVLASFDFGQYLVCGGGNSATQNT